MLTWYTLKKLLVMIKYIKRATSLQYFHVPNQGTVVRVFRLWTCEPLTHVRLGNFSHYICRIWIITKPLGSWALTNVFTHTYTNPSYNSTYIYLPWPIFFFFKKRGSQEISLYSKNGSWYFLEHMAKSRTMTNSFSLTVSRIFRCIELNSWVRHMVELH